jgi:hypothetical protein
VGYFKPPPPSPPTEPRETPSWIGPPHNVLPASFALEEVLAHTDELVIQVHTGRAFREGFAFVFQLIHRQARSGRLQDPFMRRHGEPLGPELPDDLLRFGLEHSDGRKATNLGRPGFPGEEEPDAVLRQGGGGGNSYGWEFSYWAWPTPPPGPLAFVVEWPSEGVPLTRTEIDAERIRDAATRARELWPRDPSDRGGGSSSVRMSVMSAQVEKKPERSGP